jgi:hypothetical protein
MTKFALYVLYAIYAMGLLMESIRDIESSLKLYEALGLTFNQLRL